MDIKTNSTARRGPVLSPMVSSRAAEIRAAMRAGELTPEQLGELQQAGLADGDTVFDVELNSVAEG